ncbi:MAG TPA: prepilin peptidase [Alphaproteobacteria bacterium]|jgi:prepilin peptidase CpaA
MLAHSVQQIALIACAGLLLWAATTDLIDFFIPNRVCLAIAGLYPVYLLATWLGGTPADWAGGVLAAAAVFVAGFAFFNLGMVGGGDVKLLTVTALWAGLGGLAPFLLIVGLAGGLLSLLLVTAKAASYVRQPASRPADLPVWRAVLQQPAPYGVAIAVGGFFTLGQLAGLRFTF